MKVLAFVLLVLLFWLQYKVWVQEGGIPEVLQLQQEVDSVKARVRQLQERNQSLNAEVQDLKKGQQAVEERARSELGMIKKGEVYYQVIDPASDQKPPARLTPTGKTPVNQAPTSLSPASHAPLRQP